MRILVHLLVVAALAGCATLGGVRAQPSQAGDVQLYLGTVRAAALAARNAVLATPLKVAEAGDRGPEAWYLIARGPRAEFVRVLCEQVQDDTVAVRIYVERFDPLEGLEDWSRTLFAQISLELDVVEPTASWAVR
jgi:hypothetical protein